MRTRKRFQPQMEGMEAMVLLSGAASALHAKMMVDATPAGTITLAGTAHGRFVEQQQNPDTGKTFQLNGMGIISPIGRANVSGSLQFPGFIMGVPATGTLHLRTAHGSLTLQLTQVLPTAATSVPAGQSEFSYKITQATGRFQGDQGSGLVDIMTTADANNASIQTIRGRFTATFLPGPSPLART